MMDVVKKNMVSIVCGVIALVAIVAIFWPIKGYFTDLQTRADQRVGVYRTLGDLLKKSRSQPQLTLDDAAERPKLDRFPTEPVVAWGQAAVDQLKHESQSMFDTAIKLNTHSLLVPDSLPAGGDGLYSVVRDTYRRTVDLTVDDNRKNSYLVKIVKGGFPPSDTEVSAEKLRVQNDINSKAALNGAGQVMNQDVLEADIKARLPRVRDDMRMKAAQNCLVYIQPDTFDRYQQLYNLPTGSIPPALIVFYAQFQLWANEDICRAVADANKDATNVMDAPIKHLERIRVQNPLFQTVGNGNFVAPTGGVEPGGDMPKSYGASPTGRTTSSVFDMVRCQVWLYADATQLPLVLQSFSRNRFLSVYNVSMENTDGPYRSTLGYYYGDNPIVHLKLDCEIMMLRKWTIPLMPHDVRTQIGIPDEPAK